MRDFAYNFAKIWMAIGALSPPLRRPCISLDVLEFIPRNPRGKPQRLNQGQQSPPTNHRHHKCLGDFTSTTWSWPRDHTSGAVFNSRGLEGQWIPWNPGSQCWFVQAGAKKAHQKMHVSNRFEATHWNIIFTFEICQLFPLNWNSVKSRCFQI